MNAFDLTSVDKVEVELTKDLPVVRETLSRMGIKNAARRIFYPSCYCICQDGKNYIVHFKELFRASGKPSTYDEIDALRTRTIAFFLQKWGIVKLKEEVKDILKERIHILNRGEKDDYEIVHKFRFFPSSETRPVEEMDR
jgi:hypothetical protein